MLILYKWRGRCFAKEDLRKGFPAPSPSEMVNSTASIMNTSEPRALEIKRRT